MGGKSDIVCNECRDAHIYFANYTLLFLTAYDIFPMPTSKSYTHCHNQIKNTWIEPKKLK